MVRLTLLLCAVVAAGALGVTGAAQAAQSPTANVDDQARALFRQIMSPYCPGSLLNECPSSQAAVLRDSVRARLHRGESAERIKAYLVRVYGDEVLASPPMEGWGGLAWLGAIATFFGGLALAGLWLRSRRGPAPTDRPAAPREDDAELARMRRELERHDED